MSAKLPLPTAETILRNLNDTQLTMHVRKLNAFKSYQAQYRYVSDLKWNPTVFELELAMLEFMYQELSIEIACLKAEF